MGVRGHPVVRHGGSVASTAYDRHRWGKGRAVDDDRRRDLHLQGADDATLEVLGLVHGLAEQHAQTLSLLDQAAALRSLPRQVVESLGADMSFAAQREDDAAVIRALHGARARSLADLAVPLGRGLGGHVLAMGTPRWVAEYARASTISHEFDVPVGAEGLVGVLAVPLRLGREVLGVAYAGFRQPHEFGDVMVQEVLELGRQTALSLHVAGRSQAQAQVAVQAERQRVAADLHDTLGAMLFSIGAQVRSLRGQFGDQDASPDLTGGALVARLEAIERQVSDAGAALRESLSALHHGPPGVSLSSTTQADVQAFRERTGISAQLVLLTELPPLDEHRTGALVGAVREALLNVEKHSGASSVVVTLAHMDRGVLLAVTDDGRGLNADDNGDGLGLLAAQERVARLGGRLTLTGDDGDGATLRAWIPDA